MAITYKVLPSPRVILVSCKGVVTLEEIHRYEQTVIMDDGFDAQYAELIDMRDSTDLKMTHVAMQQVVDTEKERKQYSGERKVAFVAPKDAIFGMLRMYQSMEDASPMETKVFRTFDEACDWLGFSRDDLK